MRILLIVFIFFFVIFANQIASASDAISPGPYPQSPEDLRARKSGLESSAGIEGTLSDNPKNIKCGSVADCRNNGQEAQKVSDFKGSDNSAADYPGHCRDLDPATGKYIFKPEACSRNDRSR